MSIPEAVYKWRTICPIRFHRDVNGEPQLDAPDMDDRGSKDPEHAPIVGVMAAHEIRVGIRRVELDPSAQLFATSSDPAIFAVHLHQNLIPSGARATIRLRATAAPSGSDSIRKAQLRVHFGSTAGPVLGILHVWVCTERRVNVTPHLVTIRNAAGTAVGSTAVPADIMAMVQAFWRPCGIVFNVGATVNDTVTFARPGEVAAPFSPTTGYQGTELATLLNTNWATPSINAYFVHAIRAANPGVLGLGFSRPRSVVRHLPNPGIVLGDTDLNGTPRDAQYWANDLAHEIGHFFTLEHSGNLQPPNELQDLWARRMLMYNYNLQLAAAPLAFRGDVGYGGAAATGYDRGGLVTMKTVIAADGECVQARSQMENGKNPY